MQSRSIEVHGRHHDFHFSVLECITQDLVRSSLLIQPLHGPSSRSSQHDHWTQSQLSYRLSRCNVDTDICSRRNLDGTSPGSVFISFKKVLDGMWSQQDVLYDSVGTQASLHGIQINTSYWWEPILPLLFTQDRIMCVIYRLWSLNNVSTEWLLRWLLILILMTIGVNCYDIWFKCN